MVRIRPLCLCLLLPASVQAEAAVNLAGAVQLYQAGNYPEARAALEALRLAHPGDPGVLLQLGRTLGGEKDFERAAGVLEEAVRLAPDDPDCLVALGDAYGSLADARSSLEFAEKARHALEKAVAVAPKDEAARLALITFYRKAPALAGGGIDKALRQAEEWRSFSPVAGTWQLIRLQERLKQYDSAFAACTETLRRHPGAYQLLFAEGWLAVRARDRLDPGVEALKRCLDIPAPAGSLSHAQARVELGRLYLLKNLPADARREFQAALDEEPGNREARAGVTALDQAQRAEG